MALNITLHIEEGVVPEGGTVGIDYETLRNKPSIEGVELVGDKELTEFGMSIVSNVKILDLFD